MEMLILKLFSVSEVSLLFDEFLLLELDESYLFLSMESLTKFSYEVIIIGRKLF